jgi:hypothetical protein
MLIHNMDRLNRTRGEILDQRRSGARKFAAAKKHPKVSMRLYLPSNGEDASATIPMLMTPRSACSNFTIFRIAHRVPTIETGNTHCKGSSSVSMLAQDPVAYTNIKYVHRGSRFDMMKLIYVLERLMGRCGGTHLDGTLGLDRLDGDRSTMTVSILNMHQGYNFKMPCSACTTIPLCFTNSYFE